jgi:hypothetical protein
VALECWVIGCELINKKSMKSGSRSGRLLALPCTAGIPAEVCSNGCGNNFDQVTRALVDTISALAAFVAKHLNASDAAHGDCLIS